MSTTKEAKGSGLRTRARELALQALYQVDLAGSEPMDALSTAFKAEEGSAESAALAFAEQLVRGVAEHREEIDQTIERHSHNWRIDRMAKVDRNVLRLAVFELLHLPETPRKVVLNEAIELAKKFGSEESSAFINGILDKVSPQPIRGAGR